MPTYTFQKIQTKRTKRYIDENGKKRQKTKTFFQTVNPWNTTKDGKEKRPDQIWDEINQEADEWMKSDLIK